MAVELAKFWSRMKKAALASDKPSRVVYDELLADADSELLEALPPRKKVLEKITKQRQFERERHRAAALARGEVVPPPVPGKTISPRVTKKERQLRKQQQEHQQQVQQQQAQQQQHYEDPEPPVLPPPPPPVAQSPVQQIQQHGHQS